MSYQRNGEGSWPLSVRVRDAFDSTIRHRGEHYFQSGHVRPAIVSHDSAKLSVSGSRVYEVKLDWSLAESRNIIFIHCSCPYYAGDLLCKHCWAAVLSLDDEGISQRIPGKQNARLLHEFERGRMSNETPKTSREREMKAERILNNDRSLVPAQKSSAPPPKIWLKQIQSLQNDVNRMGGLVSPSEVQLSQFKNPRTAFYVLDLDETEITGEVVISFYHQETLQSGEKGAIKHLRVSRNDIQYYSESQDRELMSLLLAHTSPSLSSSYYSNSSTPLAKGYIPVELHKDMLNKIAQTGRFYLSPKYGMEFGAAAIQNGVKALRYDGDDPYRFLLKITKDKQHFSFSGLLARGAERVLLTEPALCLRSGLVIFQDRISLLDAKYHFGWLAKLHKQGFGLVPESDGDDLVETLSLTPHCPEIEWPAELRWTQEIIDGAPTVVFTSPPAMSPMRGVLADLRFAYSDKTVSILDTSSTVLDRASRRIIQRNPKHERLALGRLSLLEGMDLASIEHAGTHPLRAHPSKFSAIVKEILSWGWGVEANGKPVRQAGKFNIKVSSGVDWFDLEAQVTYSESFSMGLPALIAALERGESLIPLGDGSLGMLPTEWLKKYAPLAQMGESDAKGYRFKKSQGILLGAWLSNEQTVTVDPDFSRLMKNIASLGNLKSKAPSRSFRGELRSYQKEGLAWLSFVGQLGFGGILADDMGLGKTIQALAHLESEYAGKTPPKRPSIVVLPKSLLFNWQEEAARFTPKLKVLAYAGQSRHALLKEIPKHDLILVTYPTLRLDFEQLQKIDFHYVIADEAQAIKNAESITHKACCLLRGVHRLAMTGTPVENGVDDLFAMLDFVSPGLLGRGVRERMSRAATHGKLDTEALMQLSTALKPFILRRTKSQVLKDLPEKMEKVLHCELSPPERKYYVELRDYYRAHLRGEIERKGIARSKIVILEALLRLRQAACHPGLIDKKRIGVDSAKVDTLLAQLEEIISEGHKALVFSQFTSFLDIVEKRLAGKKIEFSRLDGQTSASDRRERVTQFQEDPSLKVFLISLKAGGVGLNLTAADYVFILDPWWNPAAESQAIDRTHRIGQKNKVIAYRLIAKDTVEEKIAELQQSKRALADAIITADTSLLRKMTAQDVEVLLS